MKTRNEKVRAVKQMAGGWSIRTKVAAAIVTAILILTAFISINSIAYQHREAKQALKSRGRSIGNMLAYNVGPAIEFEDTAAVKEAIAGALMDPDVAAVAIFDADGSIFFSVPDNACPMYRVLFGLQAPEDDQRRCSSCHLRDYSNTPRLDLPVVAGGQRVGTARVVLSVAGLSAKFSEQIRAMLLVAIFAVLMGILAAHYLAKIITEPILRLRAGAEELAAGNLEVEVQTEGQDEIGSLASAFKQMVESLKKASQEKEQYLRELEASNVLLQKQQREIEEYSWGLETKVRERTARLRAAYEELSEKNLKLESAHNRLKQTQDRIRETERLAVVGEMAGRVAHEVLNPITALLSRTQSEREKLVNAVEAGEMAREVIRDWRRELEAGSLADYLSRREPEEAKSYGEEDLEILDSASRECLEANQGYRETLAFFENHILRTVRIIDNLRGMARVNRVVEILDVNNAIKESIELWKDGMAKRRIVCTTDLGRLPPTYADFNALIQVFSNLIKNAVQAIEASGKRGGKIRISSRCVDDRIEVRVADSGIGIPEENRQRIFDSDFSTKGSKEGTGLGLSICRRFLGELHGDIVVEESSPGSDTVFLVWLPVVQEKPNAKPSSSEPTIQRPAGTHTSEEATFG